MDTRRRDFEHVARSRPPSNDGRGPLGRTIASDASVSSRCHDPAARALEERRPRHSSAPVCGTGRPPPSLHERRGARRNRRAPGASAGGRSSLTTNARVRSSTGFPPVGRRSVRSPVVLPSISATTFQAQRPPFASLRLCVFALRGGPGFAGGFAVTSGCLCDSAFSL